MHTAAGSWGDTTDPRQPSLVLSADGRLSGTDGCNRLVGSWTSTGATVSFPALASTMMHCEGVDTWLSSAATAVVSPDVLLVHDEAGAQIGTLARSAG
ncbi:META domain-containing protein [Georgenia sp. MJ173]|uniref:META domain-containing protein n=1 Tax=Georgenia sunbinii TaxID=3117728 RepID=UPI002F269A14